MEKVVYLLGAGFSAPLGLPVMSNFLMKSKDMYFSDPTRYAHFENVFRTITDMSVAKNYYDCDLFNIEEILSILEMQESVGARSASEFKRFICDVVNHYCPEPPPVPGKTASWRSALFGGYPWDRYGPFVANLLNLIFSDYSENRGMDIRYEIQSKPEFAYGIVSLNYDLVIERIVSFICETYQPSVPNLDLHFNKLPQTPVPFDGASLALAKLHGSAENAAILAPTWNKNINETLRPAWASAFDMLQKANHLRILGYSLPSSDAYVKYLLKSAVISSPHLKTIDVICLDPSGEIKKRYDEFISFKFYRFANADIRDFLTDLRSVYYGTNTGQPVSFDNLNATHRSFVERRS